VTDRDDFTENLRDAVLIERSPRPAKRPLIGFGDVLMGFWLLIGALLALAPCRFRWRICGAIARFASRSARARHARAAMRDLAALADPATTLPLRELYTGRLAAQLDVMRGLLRGPDFATDWHGLANLEAALRGGRGVVLWVSDFAGAGEATKVALAQAGHPATHLSRPEHGFSKSAFGIRFLNPLRIRFEHRYLAARVIFDRAHPARAMFRLMGCLKRNGVVSIGASAHEGAMLVEARFLGGRMRLAAGALRLAFLADCPVLPVFTIRDAVRTDCYDVIIGTPLPLPRHLHEREAILFGAADYLARLEGHVRRRPGAWVGWRRVDHLV
jgi:lauroyl/myristoyl acyltransferase